MGDLDIRTRARALITNAVNAVLMTTDSDGYPHPRTMWTAGVDDDFTIYFLTGRNMLKVKQITAKPKVCAFWTETDGSTIGWSYTLIKGDATVSDDKALRQRFWTDVLSQYFPGGVDDPNYVIITIKPKELMLMDSHEKPPERIEL